jgi:hypothetical protein
MTPNDLFVTRALRVRGPVEEKGFALLGKDFLVFAPARADKKRAVSGHFAGVMPQAFHDVPAYVAYLSGLPPETFASTLSEAIRHSGWSRIALGEATVTRKKALLRRHRVFVSFATDKDTIRFDGPVDPSRLPEVDDLLVHWK